MMLSYALLRSWPDTFRAVAGLSIAEFDALVADIGPRHAALEQARRVRPGRRRAPGAGRPYALSLADRVMVILLWLRLRPERCVLEIVFGIAQATRERYRQAIVPLLAGSSRALVALQDSDAICRQRVEAVKQHCPELARALNMLLLRPPRPDECKPPDISKTTFEHLRP